MDSPNYGNLIGCIILLIFSFFLVKSCSVETEKLNKEREKVEKLCNEKKGSLLVIRTQFCSLPSGQMISYEDLLKEINSEKN